MRVLFFIVFCLFCIGSVESYARSAKAPAAAVGVASIERISRNKNIMNDGVLDVSKDRHVIGLMAIRGNQRHVTLELATRLVRYAREVISRPENKWMPIHIFLGLAVNESDLKYWLRSGLDCGLCQNNMMHFRMPYYRKVQLCRKIAKDPKRSMELAMQELNTIKVKYCNDSRIAKLNKWYKRRLNITMQDRWQCILNVYNQGPRFISPPWYNCGHKWHNRHESGPLAKFEKRMSTCKHRNRYWVRTMCFAKGIELGKTPKKRKGGRLVRASCRYAWTMAWVRRIYDW